MTIKDGDRELTQSLWDAGDGEAVVQRLTRAGNLSPAEAVVAAIIVTERGCEGTLDRLCADARTRAKVAAARTGHLVAAEQAWDAGDGVLAAHHLHRAGDLTERAHAAAIALLARCDFDGSLADLAAEAHRVAAEAERALDTDQLEGPPGRGQAARRVIAEVRIETRNGRAENAEWWCTQPTACSTAPSRSPSRTSTAPP